MRFAELDAVTVDGYGTLLRLRDPLPLLTAALERHGVERASDDIAAAFAAEVRHYRPRAHLARDGAALDALRLQCVGVFLDALAADLPPAAFVHDFLGSLVFEPVPGAAEALRELRRRRLLLAVVANWDCALEEHLRRTRLAPLFDTIVSSARAGVPKPDPAIFRLALTELGVAPSRALHVGDEPLDEEGARAAGMRFAAAPLASAFEGWT